MEEIKDFEQYQDKNKRETLLSQLEISRKDASNLVRRILEDEVEKALEKKGEKFSQYYDFLLKFCTEIANRAKVSKNVKRLVSILNEMRHDEYLTILDDYGFLNEEDICFSKLIEHCGKDSKIVANSLRRYSEYGQSMFARCCALETIGKYKIKGLKEKLKSFIDRELGYGHHSGTYELGYAERALEQFDEN